MFPAPSGPGPPFSAGSPQAGRVWGQNRAGQRPRGRAARPGQEGPGPAGARAPSAAPGLREALPRRGAFAARLGLEGTPQPQAGPGDLSRGPQELAEAPHASREPNLTTFLGMKAYS